MQKRMLLVLGLVLGAIVVVQAAASYPSGIKSFSTKLNGDVIQASFINDLQDEVVAIETALINGFAHDLVPDDTSNNRDLGSSGAKWHDGHFSNDVTIDGDLTVGGTVSGSIPAGMVMFSSTGSCPTGWAEYTDARGRYIVGLVSGGTNEGTVGTALTNTENRPVGQHTHSVTDPGHVHTVPRVTATGGGTTTFERNQSATTTANVNTGSATTGITIDNAGSVAGTNAPYIQLIACEKS